MRKVVYSLEALEDMQTAKAWIIEQFENEELAEKSLRRLSRKIHGLCDFPYMGLKLERVIGIPTEYYYLFCKPNYVFYRVEGGTIRIIRVLHERQDYMRTMFGIIEAEDIEE